MAQSGKGKLNFRCPSCFMRDLDIDMFYDKEKGEYYCLRCQFRGTEEDVLAVFWRVWHNYVEVSRTLRCGNYYKFLWLQCGKYYDNIRFEIGRVV